MDTALDSDLSSPSPGVLSVLQRACELGLPDHVDALLDRNADPNHAAAGTAPAVVLAAKNGHYKVLTVHDIERTYFVYLSVAVVARYVNCPYDNAIYQTPF